MNQIIRATLKKAIRQFRLLRRWNNERLVQSYQKYVIPNDEIIVAESNSYEKSKLVERFSVKWPKRCSKLLGQIDKIMVKRGNNGESDGALIEDVLFCCLAYGFEPDEYFSYNLQSRNAEERRKFMSDRDTMISVFMLNDSIDIDLFNDKANTYDRFREFYRREALCISSEKDYKNFRRFIDNRDEIVKKAVGEAMGRSIELISLDKYKGNEKKLFNNLLRQGKVLLEEKVIQAPYMSAFNSSSVNTVRLITFNTKSGVIVPYCFLKTGREGSFVDNGGAGGIFIGVDAKTGVTNTDGYDENGVSYEFHPDTGKQFKGFALPNYSSALELSKKLSSLVPTVKFVGWDLAYTKDGWVVIEGNGMSQLIGPQTTLQRGIKEEIRTILRNTSAITNGEI